MAAECEAILLGREPIHGSANATALATLVKSLLRKSEPRRKYILRCTRDSGLQMSPYRRQEDEGFESDEDLTSLGSYEDTSSSMYVSDHALRVKHLRNHLLQQHAANGKSSQNGTDAATSGSVSSVGTDSANSSGASDNDDTDNSFSGSTGSSGNNKSCGGDVDSECFSFHEVAFCHTDPSLPKVIVWVVKTRRQSKTSNEYSYGLEAIVFLCQNEQKFRTLYKNFQELSRRQKLDKPVRYRSKDMVGSSVTIDRSSKSHPDTSSDYHRIPNSNISKLVADVTPAPAKDTKPPSGNGGSNHAAMYNLVQRVDTDGVTHIEVTRPATFDRPAIKTLNESNSSSSSSSASSSIEPSSIISINTPDSGDVKMKKSSTGSSSNSSPDKLIEGVIRADVDTKTTAPERPERKKQHKNGKEKAPQPPHEQHKTKEKVVRGQFVRVSVDQKTLSSPMASRAGIWLFGSEAKPCGTTLSYPSRLVWTSPASGPENGVDTSRKSRRTAAADTTRNGSIGSSHHRRSKSSSAGVFYRRSESPKRYPMSHRYIDTIHINNSLPNRFFGKLKELAGSNHNNSNKFRRRNSIGDLTNPTFYQVDTKKIDSANSLAKSTPNLKSVIKNKNSKFYKDGYDSNLEPKKVTFSAYATVQVVD
ncbi:dentin sialophosphoprotein-like [Planococcus citri]|uniref:dentin sialophosphoprotein-like n=1 Tax=Planococcus citri TaxID=170843 RepID=UPI0031F9651D